MTIIYISPENWIRKVTSMIKEKIHMEIIFIVPSMYADGKVTQFLVGYRLDNEV